MDCKQKELREYFPQNCKFFKEFHTIKDEIISNEILLNKKDVNTLNDQSEYMNSFKNYCEEEKTLRNEINMKKNIIELKNEGNN